MNWIDRLLKPPVRGNIDSKSSVPEGLWTRCESCKAVLYKPDLETTLMVCIECTHHMSMTARARIASLSDTGSVEEFGAEVIPIDALRFVDSKKYVDRIRDAQQLSKETDALLVSYGAINMRPAVVAAFEFSFMGGSMGAVVGERFARGVQVACEKKAAFVCVTASGGARMQEGLLSLMQMAKTNAALTMLEQLRLPFISVLSHPTMGGVSASFAFLGDLVIAEPNALIGFAGQRVIANTVKSALPEGFQRAEFLLEKGAIDAIVPRLELKDYISLQLELLS